MCPPSQRNWWAVRIIPILRHLGVGRRPMATSLNSYDESLAQASRLCV
jgi:ribosomal protein S19E (S16A)